MQPGTQEWRHLAKRLVIRNDAFIDGKYVKAVSGDTFECRSPVDGKLLTAVTSCAEQDVDVAVAAARAAPSRPASGVTCRPRKERRVLSNFADLLIENSEELALLETLDMGKPIRFSAAVDIQTAANSIRWSAEAIDKLYGEIAPTGPDILALVSWEALGVVGVVVPCEFPVDHGGLENRSGIGRRQQYRAGKPAEQSPLSAIFLGELAVQAGISCRGS